MKRFYGSSSTALLIFFSTPTGAGIVAADLLLPCGESKLCRDALQLLQKCRAHALMGEFLRAELLAQLLAMQSEKWYIENTEKARDEARDHAMALKLHNFAGSH